MDGQLDQSGWITFAALEVREAYLAVRTMELRAYLPPVLMGMMLEWNVLVGDGACVPNFLWPVSMCSLPF